jgi:hypothetical protein
MISPIAITRLPIDIRMIGLHEAIGVIHDSFEGSILEIDKAAMKRR